MMGTRMGYELCFGRADDDAVRVAAEMAAPHDFNCSVSAAEVKMEITTKTPACRAAAR